MSGSVGLQGRYATSFGYGPRLGVGRYPNGERPANSLPSITARPSPGIVGFPSTEVAPFEMMQPAPAQAAPLAPLGDGGGGMDIGSLLMAAGPAAALYGGRYLYKKLAGDQNAPGAVDNYTQFNQDIQSNFNLAPVGNLAADAVLPMAAMDPAVPGAIFNAYGYNAAPAIGGNGLSVSDIGWQNSSTGNFPAFDALPDELFSNMADVGFAGAGDVGGFAPDMGPPMPGDLAGSAASSWNPLNWSVTTPGTGALGLDVGVGPLTFNPVNMAAGAAGSYGGTRLAQHLAPYSGGGQRLGSTIGGIAGGALGGMVLGPIGALAGAFLGSLGGGTIGADSPNYPYSYFGGTIGNNGIDFWDPASRNGGDASAVRPLTNALRDYVTGRMAAEGMVVNPYRGGERAFSAGTTADPGGKFFVGAADINPAQAAYGMNTLGFGLLQAAHSAGLWPDQPSQTLGVWRGDNVADLPGQVWQQLVSNGSIGAPGSFQAPAPAAPAPPPEPMADPWANYGSAG